MVTDTHTNRKAKTERSPFRAFGVTSLQPVIKERSNWNSLPKEIVCAESTNVFKNKLDKHWGYLKFSVDFEETLKARQSKG